MSEEEIRLYASHHQFYVQDSDPKGDSGEPTFWTAQACKNRLALGDGLLAVGTGSYGFVKVRVEYLAKAPRLNLAKWDHVTECGLDVKSGLLLIFGCIANSGLFFMVTPGHFRVRVCHANLKESEQEVASDWTGDFGDWYLVQLWPSRSRPAKILKRRKVG